MDITTYEFVSLEYMLLKYLTTSENLSKYT